MHDRKSLDCSELLVELWMFKALIVRSRKEQKEHAIGNWREVDPYYIALEGIAEMCPIEFVNDELAYSAEETSKISGSRCSLVSSYCL